MDDDLHANLPGSAAEGPSDGDVLVFEAAVPADLRIGDVLATPVTGAYGHTMGSNYNLVTRPPVVFVRDGDARLVVRRQTYEDLLACDND